MDELQQEIGMLRQDKNFQTQKISTLLNDNKNLTQRIQLIEQHHSEEIQRLKKENNAIEKVVSSQQGLKFSVSNAQIEDISQTLKNLSKDLKVQDFRNDEIDSLKEQISELKNQIINQRQKYQIKIDELKSDYDIALKEAKISERFNFEAKLGAKEMELLQEIDDMSEKLSKSHVMRSTTEVDQKLLTQMQKRLAETQNIALDQQDIQKGLKQQVNIKNQEIQKLKQKNTQLEHIISKNGVRMSARSHQIN